MPRGSISPIGVCRRIDRSPSGTEILEHQAMIWQGVAVGIGAALGALLRWRLGTWLNPVFPTIPFGTLASNLIGGFIMGLCMEYFSRTAAIPPELRLGGGARRFGGGGAFFALS